MQGGPDAPRRRFENFLNKSILVCAEAPGDK
jgi:hypothetical protein